MISTGRPVSYKSSRPTKEKVAKTTTAPVVAPKFALRVFARGKELSPGFSLKSDDRELSGLAHNELQVQLTADPPPPPDSQFVLRWTRRPAGADGEDSIANRAIGIDFLASLQPLLSKPLPGSQKIWVEWKGAVVASFSFTIE
jgi:hypothetical protein